MDPAGRYPARSRIEEMNVHPSYSLCNHLGGDDGFICG